MSTKKIDLQDFKEKARQSVESLQKSGIEVWMITGDNERTATAIGEKLGITNIMAKVLPGEKAEKIKEHLGEKVIEK